MNFKFQLALFSEDDELKTIEEWLKLELNDLALSLSDATLFLESNGKTYIGEDWNLGELKVLVNQINEAIVRLEKGEAALIRSCIMEDDVPYIFIEPSGVDSYKISMFLIDNPEFSMLFPIDGVCGSKTVLYEYVAENREHLLDQAQSDDELFSELVFPKEVLITELKNGIALYEELLKLI